ncbi:MAG: sulfite exporter TauE/SafE family protein [Xanthomonadales bacterium]|nr:sulfite exporter TauE/SafE family protein [Xanthomonadales bacterium]
MLNKSSATLKTEKSAPLFGFVAGILGGAYGMNGPPLVAYGTLRRWSPQQFRATLQGYFLPASIVVMFGYWAAGLWAASVTRYYLLTLPVVIIAIFAGRALNKRFSAHRFMVCVHVGLLVVGAALLWQALA